MLFPHHCAGVGLCPGGRRVPSRSCSLSKAACQHWPCLFSLRRCPALTSWTMSPSRSGGPTSTCRTPATGPPNTTQVRQLGDACPASAVCSARNQSSAHTLKCADAAQRAAPPLLGGERDACTMFHESLLAPWTVHLVTMIAPAHPTHRASCDIDWSCPSQSHFHFPTHPKPCSLRLLRLLHVRQPVHPQQDARGAGAQHLLVPAARRWVAGAGWEQERAWWGGRGTRMVGWAGGV